jgi:hypothetical protein
MTNQLEEIEEYQKSRYFYPNEIDLTTLQVKDGKKTYLLKKNWLEIRKLNEKRMVSPNEM